MPIGFCRFGDKVPDEPVDIVDVAPVVVPQVDDQAVKSGIRPVVDRGGHRVRQNDTDLFALLHIRLFGLDQ